jgi:glycosyltransferase involved in cell wall biosynthesis
MRVLVYWSLGGVGGIQRFDALLTKALGELGLDVTVLMPSNVDVNALRRYHGVNFGELRNIKVVKYGVDDCHNQYCSLLSSFVGNNVLNELARHHDLLFLDTLFLRPFHAGTRIVFYLHDRAVMTSKPRPVFTLKPHRLFLQGLLSLGSRYDVLTRRATRVYANSLFTAYLTENALGVRPGVLYPPIDTELIRKYAVSNKEPIVSMLARFSSSKGQDFAIRAFSKAASICSDEEDLELVLMGAANDLASLSYVKHLMKLSTELGVSKRVRFMVNPSIDTVYRVLGRSTVFIHVKPYEPFGIVVAEAMAAGAIPIVHKSGGPWIDIVRMGKYGLGFSNEEEAALGMCRAMEIAKELRDAVMERAREFSYEAFRNRVDAIVKELGI